MRWRRGHYLHVIDIDPTALDSDTMRAYHLDKPGSTGGIAAVHMATGSAAGRRD